MAMNREAIYSAVFALISGMSGIVTASRRAQHFADVLPVNQPAVFMTQTKELAAAVTRQPTKWTLHVDILVYVHTGEDMNIIPSTLLNPYIDLVTSMFDPNPALGEQTLGGLVERCRIEGAIATDEGVLGNQGIAIIPVVIYLAN